MDVGAFDFTLPDELIAQEPAPERTASRLLRLHRKSGVVEHASIDDLPALLTPGDLLVVNNSRVFPARLIGRRVPSGGAVECLLARQVESSGASAAVWLALMHPGQKLKPGGRVIFEGEATIHGEILERSFFGRRTIRLWTDDGSDLDAAVDLIGHVPLPPYIHRDDAARDRERYQTVFARARGSVAAPTAGLHFSTGLIARLRERGVEMAEITLHVGYGTFQPVRVDRVEDHRLDAERFEIPAAAADAIARARDAGRRVIAVGTTTTRTLEAAVRAGGGTIRAGSGATDLFIYPGFAFEAIDGLLTNFHLPRSSLLMLVAAFAGREQVLAAYDAAIAAGYRFYSYGDAMLIA